VLGIELKVNEPAEPVPVTVAIESKLPNSNAPLALGVDNEPDNKVDTCIDGCA
jgi:hypothetical protein